MKFEMYGVEFKLELLVTDSSTEIIILDSIENITVADESIYHSENCSFDLEKYVNKKVYDHVDYYFR